MLNNHKTFRTYTKKPGQITQKNLFRQDTLQGVDIVNNAQAKQEGEDTKTRSYEEAKLRRSEVTKK